MKNTVYAIVAASLAMLATSGIVALATAAPERSTERAVEMRTTNETVDGEVDAMIGAFIDAQYRQVMNR